MNDWLAVWTSQTEMNLNPALTLLGESLKQVTQFVGASEMNLQMDSVVLFLQVYCRGEIRFIYSLTQSKDKESTSNALYCVSLKMWRLN